MQLSLVDAVLSNRLSQAGLQALPTAGAGGTASSGDVYAPDPSKLVELSGYGQLLSAASRFNDTLAAGAGSFSGTRDANSTSSSVATASYDASAAAAAYSLNVTELAKGRSVASAYFASSSEGVVSVGSFTIQTGTVDGVGAFTADSSEAKTVTVTDGSLTGLAAAINQSGAGVTAVVENDAYGYRLKITGNQIGAGNSFQLQTNTSDPFVNYTANFNILNFAQTQAATNASYTVNGGSVQTSSSNSVPVGTGINATLKAVGTTTLATVDATTLAQNLTSAYNALQGSIKQATGTGGAVNTNAGTANQLATDLRSQATATYVNAPSSLTSLSQLGFSLSNGDATSPLALNTTTLQAALNSDTSGTLSLLAQAVSALKGTSAGYTDAANTNPANGLLAKQLSLLDSIKTGITTANPGLSGLSSNVVDNLVRREIGAGAAALGLSGISIYA